MFMKYLNFKIFLFCPSRCKAIPIEKEVGPEGYGRLRLSEFLDSWPMKSVGSSALSTGRLPPSGLLLVLISVRGWVDRSVTVRPKRLIQWKIPIAPTGIRTRNLLAWSVTLQPTAPPRTPSYFLYNNWTTRSITLFFLKGVVLGLLPYWMILDKILLWSITVL